MPFPADGPTTVPLVKAHIGLTDTVDDDFLSGVVAAVNTRVLQWPVAQVADGALDWAGEGVAHIVLGATMLAARLNRRRNTPDGVATFGAEGPLYVQRNDPDVALLLGLGQHKKPVAR
jgi:hypothetical protein